MMEPPLLLVDRLAASIKVSPSASSLLLSRPELSDTKVYEP